MLDSAMEACSSSSPSHTLTVLAAMKTSGISPCKSGRAGNRSSPPRCYSSPWLNLSYQKLQLVIQSSKRHPPTSYQAFTMGPSPHPLCWIDTLRKNQVFCFVWILSPLLCWRGREDKQAGAPTWVRYGCRKEPAGSRLGIRSHSWLESSRRSLPEGSCSICRKQGKGHISSEHTHLRLPHNP